MTRKNRLGFPPFLFTGMVKILKDSEKMNTFTGFNE